LGRERNTLATLTGRLPVWQQCLPFIGQRPLRGYGYESFWTADRLITFAKTQGWALPDAHSGYVNLLLGVGIIGLLAYIVILILGFIRSISVYKRLRKIEYIFAGSSIIFLIMNIIVVGSQLDPYITSFVHMVIIAKLGFSRSL
jgi:O-antigen ligase